MFEIPVFDFKKAKAFYEKVFDWKAELLNYGAMRSHGVHKADGSEASLLVAALAGIQ